MSTLSDVQALYGGVQTTWAKNRAHVVAHVVLATIIFGVGRASIPAVSLPAVDPKQIIANDWFVLGKDTGIIFAALLVPILAIAVYGAALRACGRVLVTVAIAVFPASTKHQYRLNNAWALTPLALATGKDEFSLTDLTIKASELRLKLQSKKDEQWTSFQEAIEKLTNNAQVYLGDFLSYFVLWIALFELFPRLAWVQANAAHYWQVSSMLLLLVWFGWFRVSRAIAVVPTLSLSVVSLALRTDPDMRAALDAPEERQKAVRDRLDDLLKKERADEDSRPSLRKYARHVSGGGKESGRRLLKSGWPFPYLYDKGLRFSWDEERNTRYGDNWLSGYRAYLYYRLRSRLTVIGKALWQVVRYLVTGAP